MADPKSFQLAPAVHEYLLAHGTPPDELQQRLIAETAELGGIARMQIAPEQGAFMTILTRAVGAKRAVEIGTFTGYSALAIARGLPGDGHLLCCDVNEEWTAIGRRYWDEAGVGAKIELRIGPAVETLEALPPGGDEFDLAFIDADKPNYVNYYEALLPRLKPNGLILVDNVLWGGRVVETGLDESGTAIQGFNDHVAGDERVDAGMLPISDGLPILRKR